jgi:hypothetical protein
MSFGAKIINNQGFVQIDETHSNFSLFAEGTSSVSGQNVLNSMTGAGQISSRYFDTLQGTKIYFPISVGPKIIAVRCNTPGVFFATPLMRDNYFVAFTAVPSQQGEVTRLDPVNSVIDWRIYIPNNLNYTPVENNIGIKIFSPSNELIFNSNRKYLKINNICNINDTVWWQIRYSPVTPFIDNFFTVTNITMFHYYVRNIGNEKNIYYSSFIRKEGDLLATLGGPTRGDSEDRGTTQVMTYLPFLIVPP